MMPPAITRLWQNYSARLFAKSLTIVDTLRKRSVVLALVWMACTIPLALGRFALSPTPIHDLGDAATILAAYSLVIASPIAGYLIAKHAFASPDQRVQPSIRFAFWGRWRALREEEARANPAFGPVGFMASLIIGLLLNVAVRTGEFFVAVPAMNHHAPAWGETMFLVMAADVVVTNFFYMVAFVMAMRTIPLFPRMLLFAWGLDIVMQFAIAHQIMAVGGAPAMVTEPLLALLNANVTKVMIGAAIWLPYLLLSQRVNITYRHRLAAD